MTRYLTSLDELHALYGEPAEASVVKVAKQLTPDYRAWIEAASFCALATVGPEGTDCSPRGDDGAVVKIVDDNRLALPDRRGNNRIDTLRNILRDPRCSLMFLVPGSETVIRVNGQGKVTADAEILERYAHRGAKPRSVLMIDIDEVYFQCARAIMRSKLWSGAQAPDLPQPGAILSNLTNGDVGGDAYDKNWPERAKKTMW